MLDLAQLTDARTDAQRLEFLPQESLSRIGSSAEVRVLHPPRPAGEQVADALRRLFLRRIDG